MEAVRPRLSKTVIVALPASTELKFVLPEVPRKNELLKVPKVVAKSTLDAPGADTDIA